MRIVLVMIFMNKFKQSIRSVDRQYHIDIQWQQNLLQILLQILH